MKKKKQKKAEKPSDGVILLIVVLCFVVLGYEPMMQVLSGRKTLEKAVTEAIEQKIEQVPTKPNTTPAIDAMPAESSGIELPAPLTDRPELILKRKGYTVSYNEEMKQPNWVAWELNKERLIERESRTDKFLPDPDLDADEAVTTDDYRGSGYDRGHMCPAGDNRWHWKAMQESFYMTNICPQLHKLNNGDWKELEEACRRWAEAKGQIYIVCGPIFYRSAKPSYIGRNQRIRVPEAFFKVVLCPDPPQAIGFLYKNEDGNRKMESYTNSIDQVERITGIDFFPALPDEVETAIESTARLSDWNLNN